GNLLQRGRVVELYGALQGYSPHERGARSEVGGIELGAHPPGEAVAKPLSQPGQGLRWPVAGEHDLFAACVKGVEGVDEFFLCALLSLERLDIVDQEGIE